MFETLNLHIRGVLPPSPMCRSSIVRDLVRSTFQHHELTMGGWDFSTASTLADKRSNDARFARSKARRSMAVSQLSDYSGSELTNTPSSISRESH